MNIILHWLTSPEWAQVVKALLHSLWQGALIALALGVVMRRLTNPISRYRCSLGALASVMVAGIVTWAVINASNQRPPTPAQNQPAANHNQITPNFVATTEPNTGDKIIVTAKLASAPAPSRWTAWLAFVWLVGAGLMLGRAGTKVAGAEQLRRSCRPLTDSRVTELLAEARRAVGLARQVRLAVTDKLTSPAVVGVLVPTLILPLSLMTTLTPEQIRFVLLHELAHIRRGDYLANLFQLFTESLLFFNPAVWWISHQVRREREACCDALAIELSGAPADYARTLVHVAENILSPAPIAAPAFGDEREPSLLVDRVQRLLVPGYRPSLRLTWRAMLAALVVGGALLVLSAAGTRTTVAAILKPNPQAAYTSDQRVTNEIATTTTSSESTYQTMIFAIDTQTGFANLQRLAGLEKSASLKEQFRKVLADAGMKSPVANMLFMDSGQLMVRGAKAQMDLINQVVLILNGESTNTVQNLASRPVVVEVPPAISKPNDNSTNLYTRFFKVDPNTFSSNMRKQIGLASTNIQEVINAMRKVFSDAGADLQSTNKSVFFNDRTGILVVRATKNDLDAIETILQALNYTPPIVNIKVKWVEIESSSNRLVSPDLLWNSLVVGNSNGLIGILTDPQFRLVLRALQQRDNVNLLSEPDVTTLSDRQAQMQVGDLMTIVKGINPLALTAPGIVTTNEADIFQTEQMLLGQVIDLVPHVSGDGYTIHLTAIPSINEFLGYDQPTNSLTVYVNGKKRTVAQPLPRFRTQNVTVNATVWDGQTLVLGGMTRDVTDKIKDKTPVLGDLPLFGRAFRSETNSVTKKTNLVFVTPTIIDPAGNRVHAEDEMPFATNAVPSQRH